MKSRRPLEGSLTLGGERHRKNGARGGAIQESVDTTESRASSRGARLRLQRVEPSQSAGGAGSSWDGGGQGRSEDPKEQEAASSEESEESHLLRGSSPRVPTNAARGRCERRRSCPLDQSRACSSSESRASRSCDGKRRKERRQEGRQESRKRKGSFKESSKRKERWQGGEENAPATPAEIEPGKEELPELATDSEPEEERVHRSRPIFAGYSVSDSSDSEPATESESEAAFSGASSAEGNDRQPPGSPARAEAEEEEDLAAWRANLHATFREIGKGKGSLAAKALEQIVATSPTQLGSLVRTTLKNIHTDVKVFQKISRSEDRSSAAVPTSEDESTDIPPNADELTSDDQRLRDLLPLPMDVDAAESALPVKKVSAEIAEARRAWTRLLILALNFLYGCRKAPMLGPPSESQLVCLGRLAQAADVGCEEAGNHLCLPTWEDLLRKRRIDYQGDEAQAPENLSWKQIEPGLPRPGLAGSLNPEDFAEGFILELLKNPEKVARPPDGWVPACSATLARRPPDKAVPGSQRQRKALRMEELRNRRPRSCLPEAASKLCAGRQV